MNEHRSKIITAEWGLVIGAVVTIDIIEGLLDGVAIGLIINRFIDLFVGFTLFFYFTLRGVKMTWQRSVSLLFAFVAEMIPIVDIAPLWSVDVVYIMLSVKAEDSKIFALANMSANLINKNQKKSPTLQTASPGAVPPVIANTKPPILPKSKAGPMRAPVGAVPPVIPPPIISNQAAPGAIPPKISPTFKDSVLEMKQKVEDLHEKVQNSSPVKIYNSAKEIKENINFAKKMVTSKNQPPGDSSAENPEKDRIARPQMAEDHLPEDRNNVDKDSDQIKPGET